MGIKLLDKRKYEKKLKEAKEETKKFEEEIVSKNKSIQDVYKKIGSKIVENEITVDNDEVNKLIYEAKSILEQLSIVSANKNRSLQQVNLYEEKLRNVAGKVTCPKCGKVFSISKEMEFCSKCGTKLKVQ